jgi:maltose O-acetyltransferase
VSNGLAKIWRVLCDEVTGLHPRLQAFTIAQSFLPKRQSGRSRARLFAMAGFRVGEDTLLEGCPRITGQSGLEAKLTIGKGCTIGDECVFDLTELVTIGDQVTLSPGTMILTSTHEMASAHHRAGKVITMPVSIGAGAVLGARCIILPGAHIGEGAVVEPGTVVNKEVAPHTRVGGIPAVVREKPKANGS